MNNNRISKNQELHEVSPNSITEETKNMLTLFFIFFMQQKSEKYNEEYT
jgi:hypothetical protein